MPLTLEPEVSTNRTVVQRLNPLRCPDWDALLLTHPDYSFFHGASWARVLHDTYGSMPSYFAIIDGEGTALPSRRKVADCSRATASPPRAACILFGLFPVMEVSNLFLGHRGISLPFTDECRPLATDPSMFHGLWQAAIRYGKSRKWKFLACHGGNGYFHNAPPSLSFFGHELDLSGGEARLFSNLHPAVRRAIRKANKSTVSVEVSQSPDGMRSYYSLHCLTRKKHGLPPQPFSLFENVHRHVVSRGQGCVVIGRHKAKTIAAVVIFYLGKKAIFKFGASDGYFQQLRANNLVMWEAIRWSALKGLSRFHFGRTSIANEGLRRYKLGWGTTEQIIRYFKYALPEERFVPDKDRVYGWYNRVFVRMPIPIARLAGRILYEWLPSLDPA